MKKPSVILMLLCATVLSVQAQKSMDEIDRESFNAQYKPFQKAGISVTLKPQAIVHSQPTKDLMLNGNWQLAKGGNEKERLGGNWPDAITASVPGSVHGSLWKAGIIPDPYLRQNDSIATRQSYEAAWWYKKEFSITDKLNAPRLIFDGIANKCTVWLNGVKLGNHEGMFGGPFFDVNKLLKEKNTLIVKLEPIPRIFEENDSTLSNTSWRNTVVFNCVYGWHYSRIPSLGIWRPVYIKNHASVEIEHPFIATRSLDGDMSLQLTLRSASDKPKGTLKVSVLPDNFEGEETSFDYKIASSRKEETVCFDFKIKNPRLWWPNGKGDPNLYKLKISFVPDNQGTADYAETSFGIRTIKMAPSPEGVSPDRYNWTFVINDKPMFVKGTGWCTMDQLMDFPREKYDHLLSIAKQQNIQMLRAWGGGIPETDDFYDLCNRYGIMIIQEWPTAWDSHLTQPYNVLKETVELNTLRIRNNPCLVMYGGGNESPAPFGEAIDMIGRTSIELDGTRPFHRGEPWGGSTHNYYCWWERAHLNHALNMTSPFWGEFGIASLPQKESVMKYLSDSEKNVWPLGQKSDFVHHTPIFGIASDLQRLAQYSGYLMPDNTIDHFITGSQLAQVVAVRHTLERARTRWPESSGALYYKLNDNYPAASWAAVDWFGAIKPVHYFVQNSFAPLASVILFNQTNMSSQAVSLPVFLLDDNLDLKGKSWEINISCYNHTLALVKQKSFQGQDNQKEVNQLGSLNLDTDQTRSPALLFVSEVRSEDKLLFRTFYFMNFEVQKGSLFNLPRTTLATERSGNRIKITNTGKLPAVGVNIQCPENEYRLIVSENFFWLNPGESKTVDVNLSEEIKTDCWNLEGNPFIN
ncbi:glycoside hydrolase family 2 protein [Parabacteroides chinchillae]|nr:sugar-binding domain-containing protein [Parabacteroides chinchillae]